MHIKKGSEAGMKNWKLHLWLVVNLSVVISVYAFPFLIKTPLLIVFFISNFLIRTKEEVEEEYTKDLSSTSIFFGLLLVAFLVVSAFAGFTAYINSFVSESSTRMLALITGCCFLLGYCYLLFNSGNDKKNNKCS